MWPSERIFQTSKLVNGNINYRENTPEDISGDKLNHYYENLNKEIKACKIFMQLKVILKDTSWISICIVCLFSSSILSILYFCLFESFTVSQSSVMFWTPLHIRHTIPSSSYRWKCILIFQNMCSLNILNNLDYHQGPKHRNHIGSQFSVFSNWLDPSFFLPPSRLSHFVFVLVTTCFHFLLLSVYLHYPILLVVLSV